MFAFFGGLTHIPLILVKNLKILPNLLPIQKGLDMMFDVVDKKKSLWTTKMSL